MSCYCSCVLTNVNIASLASFAGENLISLPSALISPILSSGEATPQILWAVLGSSVQDAVALEFVQRRTMKLVEGLEHKSDGN